ncbi:MAG: hypothetical protein ACKOHK_08415 [Planctomycetia bacterium]
MAARSTVALVLLHFAATAFMTGLIWYVQVVHYPLMAGWPHDQFGAWEARHRELTGLVVIPPILLEGATAVLLLARSPRGAAAWLAGVGLVLLAGIWASTGFLQVPCHDLLALEWDDRVHARLVQTNWLRTVLWTGRLGLAAALVPLLAVDATRRTVGGSRSAAADG